MLRFAFPMIEVQRIHLGIDETLFYNDPAPRGKRITYMPRRGGDDLSQVMELLNNRGALTGWDVVPLDGLSHEVVASNLRTSRIFLAFTYQEGFGLPAAEAMACGNFVIGYHGHGGREFFQNNFSAAVETGDVLSFARRVEAAISHSAHGSSSPRSQGRRAAEFIKSNYPMKREIEDVIRIYGALLQGETKTAQVGL
jgi:glycosyltransferase involved in cell wall biosynthesis